MLEDVEGVMTIEVTLGFVGVCWEVGWGVMEQCCSSTAPEGVRIRQHFLKDVMDVTSAHQPLHPSRKVLFHRCVPILWRAASHIQECTIIFLNGSREIFSKYWSELI